MNHNRDGFVHPRLVVGLFVMALGALFLLDNMRIVDFGDVIRFWPLAPIAIGLTMVLQPRGNTNRGVGGFLVVAGTWVLLYDFDIVPYSFWDGWPLVLIGAGAWLVYRAVVEPEVPTARGSVSPGQPGDAPSVTGDSTISAFGFLGGVVRKSTSRAFQAADVTAIMGGCTIDLRDADLGPELAVVDAFAFWGGIEVLVPPNWVVINKVLPLLGSAEDITRQTPEPGKEILIRGTVLMGGLEIRNERSGDD
ncbi:MAG: hypothetical protein IH849_01080 [Acidobacteria bacterium]|nr:hypothetical protein [Acidobacteriota bacterium]